MTDPSSSLAQPSVYASALLTALVAPLGPGALFALHLVVALDVEATGFARSRANALASMSSESVVVGFAVLSLLAYGPRLALAIATMQAARGRKVQPWKAMAAQRDRILRTRGVSLMVGAFSFGIIAMIALEVRERTEAPLSHFAVALAAFIATAGFGMCSLADRAATFDVDGAQDARAARLRDEGRHAGPHYLDTSTARAGYDVATSADDATTVGMRAFLGGAPWIAALGALLLDAVPVGIACFVPEIAGLGAIWLSGMLLAPTLLIASVPVLAVRAALELALARLWTRAYLTATPA